MKLNLGCGNKKWAGFINVDLQDSDLDCDIRKLPFENGIIDEIHAIHVCEHFMITEIVEVLRDWHRVLKENGAFYCELPCWDKVQMHIANGGPDNRTRWALYGEPRTHKDGAPAVHKWCWSMEEFSNVLELVGFREIKSESPKFHVPDRDMRWEAIK